MFTPGLVKPELLSLVLEFEIKGSVSLPRPVGRTIHATFFEILSGLDSDLARKIHSMHPYKPFTLSLPFTGKGAKERERFYLRITSIWAPLSETLKRLVDGLNPPLNLGFFTLNPIGATVDRISSYGEIYQDYLLELKTVPKRVLLNFISPTTFRVGKVNLPFPLPHLVFRSYADKWNAFSRVHLGKFGDEAGKWIVVSNYRLKSCTVNLGQGKRVAFTGWCEFEARKGTPEFVRRCLGLLSEYAFFCGTGQGVTMGLGQTRGEIA